MMFVLPAYGIVVVALFAVGLASAPRPRFLALIAIGALAWPVSMAVIALHVHVIEPRKNRRHASQTRPGRMPVITVI